MQTWTLSTFYNCCLWRLQVLLSLIYIYFLLIVKLITSDTCSLGYIAMFKYCKLQLCDARCLLVHWKLKKSDQNDIIISEIQWRRLCETRFKMVTAWSDDPQHVYLRSKFSSSRLISSSSTLVDWPTTSNSCKSLANSASRSRKRRKYNYIYKVVNALTLTIVVDFVGDAKFVHVLAHFINRNIGGLVSAVRDEFWLASIGASGRWIVRSLWRGWAWWGPRWRWSSLATACIALYLSAIRSGRSEVRILLDERDTIEVVSPKGFFAHPVKR